MKIDKSNAHHWALLLAQTFNASLAVIFRLLARKPKPPVVILYGHQFSGNLKAIYSQWAKATAADFTCYFLSLDPKSSKKLEAAGINILRCHSPTDMLKVATAEIMITDHGLHAMKILKVFSDIRFIDVWHGIPFKGFPPEEFAVQHTYDEVWVSSSFLRKLYINKLGFPESIVKPLGYARVDKLFSEAMPETSFKTKHKIPKNRLIVTYAPTWEHEDKHRSQMPFGSSADTFFQSLNTTCEECDATLVVRSHLNTHINPEDFPNIIFCSMKDFPDTESILQETDVLLCDWSSIAFDFLALKRPTIFLDVEPPFKAGHTLGPEHRFGYIVSDVQALTEKLQITLKEPERYHTDQREIYEKVLQAVYDDNTDGKVAQRQVDRIRGMLTEIKTA